VIGEPETADVAGAAGVQDVHEPAVDGDADRGCAAGVDPVDQPQAATVNAERGHVVRPGIDRHQPAMASGERALGAEAGAGAGSAGEVLGDRRQRAVIGAGEHRYRVARRLVRLGEHRAMRERLGWQHQHAGAGRGAGRSAQKGSVRHLHRVSSLGDVTIVAAAAYTAATSS
jgi:hypothetical protein